MSWNTVVRMARIRLLSTIWANGSRWSNSAYADSEGFSGISCGVAERPAPGLMDVTNAQRNGKTIMRAPTRTRMFRVIEGRCLRIVHPFLLTAHLNQSDDQDEEEQ